MEDISRKTIYPNCVKINNMILTPVHKSFYETILKNLYKSLQLAKVRYVEIKEEKNILEVKSTPHFVTYHVLGFNYLLFLTNINGKNLNLMISKNELKYYMHQNNINDLKIFTIKLKLPIHYYNDTLFDGKLKKPDIVDEVNSTYIIYDCYKLCGQDMYNIEMDKKHEILNKKLNEINIGSQISHNDKLVQNMTLKLLPLYSDNDLQEILFNKIKQDKKINGLMFLPILSGKYYIYTNESEFNKLREMDSNIQTNKPIITDSIYEFTITRKNIPDVYELYIETDNGIFREGLAHIPDIHTSRYCKNLFVTQDKVRIKCIKSMKFNKWVPLCQDITKLSNVLF